MIPQLLTGLIQVVVNLPVPTVKKGDAFEDTMLLIDMMKQQKEKDNKQIKAS